MVCQFSSCMPEHNNQLTVPETTSEIKLTTRTTELRTSIISVRPSGRPAGRSGHETSGLDLPHSHHRHLPRIPLLVIPATSSSRPQPHTRASAQPLRVEHGRGSEETSRLRGGGQPRSGRFLDQRGRCQLHSQNPH